VAEPRRQTIGDLLSAIEDSDDHRRAELALLESCLADSGPVVAWIHGPDGHGKSSLLQAFCVRAKKAGAAAVRIDCRTVEPTAQGLLAALGELLGEPVNGIEAAAAAIARLGDRVIVAFDNYEVFRLADSWLRREFIPALDSGCRVVLVSTETPGAGWVGAGKWRQFLLDVALSPDPDAAPGTRAQSLLDAIDAPALRQGIDAISVVRRITRPMLTALCPQRSADELYEELSRLDFVESRRDGLALLDFVREFVAERLQAADPARYRDHQRAAWRVLREQLLQAPRADLWRFTADAIYLIENPVIREAFFPSESARFSVEPAAPADREPVMALAARHEPPESVDAIALWWQHLPASFHIVRDGTGAMAGFYCMAKPDDLGGDWLRFDPVARNWQAHLFARGRAAAVSSLFLRRWLSDRDGETPCPVQAAAWVDIKRTYLELRPQLRRVYLTLRDLQPYAAVATQLGFEVIDALAANLGGTNYHTALLDFGPGSVDGWICNLVAAELGVESDGLLDPAGRELVLDGERIALTPLEFGVMALLESRNGEAVSRDELLRQVWGHGHDGGSNVVDAVVRGLRRKCGEHAAMLETVRGVGYRLRA
jgi:hypothetical protein